MLPIFACRQYSLVAYILSLPIFVRGWFSFAANWSLYLNLISRHVYQTAIANLYYFIAVIHSLKQDYRQISVLIARKAILILGKHRYCWESGTVAKKTLLQPRKYWDCRVVAAQPLKHLTLWGNVSRANASRIVHVQENAQCVFSYVCHVNICGNNDNSWLNRTSWSVRELLHIKIYSCTRSSAG